MWLGKCLLPKVLWLHPTHRAFSPSQSQAVCPHHHSNPQLQETEIMKTDRDATWGQVYQWQRDGSPKAWRTCSFVCLFILHLHKLRLIRFIALSYRMSENAKKYTVHCTKIQLTFLPIKVGSKFLGGRGQVSFMLRSARPSIIPGMT